jgi:hypothetical protein
VREVTAGFSSKSQLAETLASLSGSFKVKAIAKGV